MRELTIPFTGGLVTSRDPSDLGPGEMVEATGIYYKPGDTGRAHVLATRSTFDATGETAAVDGIALCQFDTGGTDRLVAQVGTTLYSATPGATGTFASFVTGLSASASKLAVCHADDRWYLANGYDRVRVVESDGTVRYAGMLSPDQQPVAAATTTAGTDYRPTSSTSTWSDAAKAYDTSDTSYAYSSLAAAATSTETWTFGSNAATITNLSVTYRIMGYRTDTEGGSVGVGGSAASDFNVTLVVSYSKDSGGAYTTILTKTVTTAMPQKETVSLAISGVSNTDVLRVRAAFTYTSGGRSATAAIYDAKASTAGSSRTPFTPTTGFYYAITEYDSTRGFESAPSTVSELVNTASMRGTSITLPGAAGVKNTNTTHYRIYRTYDGGAYPYTLGLVGTAAYTETSFLDDFSRWSETEQPLPLVDLVEVSAQREGSLYFPLNSEPPILNTLSYFKGSLVGTSLNSPRALFYSEAGYPEGWPEIYAIEEFPMPERDELVATVVVGDNLLVAAKGAMFILTDLPRVVDGVFNVSEAVPLKGQPGCVGQYALVAYSVSGESRAAWVSRYGIHETNGVTSRRITNRLDWDSTLDTASLSTAVLHWNPKTLTLKFCYDSDGGGANDEFLLFHMAPEHQAEDGPKVTGPFAASINCLASGEVSSVYRQYSGHTTDGTVYLEEATGAETVALQTGRVYGQGARWRIYKGSLRHTAMASQSATVAVSMVDDENQETQTVSQSVALDTQRGTEFYVNRSGDYMEMAVDYSGSVAGAFQDVRFTMETQGKPGKVA